jgi:hypothetical protein
LNSKFNIGDKVVCKRASSDLQYGETYTVESRNSYTTDEIYVINSNGRKLPGSWMEDRFELVEPIEKPPLGLKPRKFAVQERLVEVLQAMTRYVEAGKKIPDEWDKEYAELYDYLRNA